MVKMFSFLFLFEHFTYLLVKPQRLTWKYLYDYSDEIKKKIVSLIGTIVADLSLSNNITYRYSRRKYLPTHLPTNCFTCLCELVAYAYL